MLIHCKNCNIIYPKYLMKTNCKKCNKKYTTCEEKHYYRMCFECIKCRWCNTREEDKLICKKCINKIPNILLKDIKHIILQYLF
jgi:hypothetical protein